MTSASSLSGVKYYMERYQLYPKKKWGQNFLIDKNVLNKIADSCEINPAELVVEIGPGMGALTEQLALRSAGVFSIDIDKSLMPLLQETLKNFSNVKLLFADILKVDLEREIVNAFNLEEIAPYKVCANIPYNITTPIIFYLLEQCPHLQSATLMLQKEVAERLLASPGGKDYGLLTIMAAYYCEIEHVMNVSHNCFFPRPEVNSSVIKIIPSRSRRVAVKDEVLFKNLVRAAFQKRRKTILNICSSFFKIDKQEVCSRLDSLKIPYQERPENLTIEQFADLADSF